jgi:hypothetical protein
MRGVERFFAKYWMSKEEENKEGYEADISLTNGESEGARPHKPTPAARGEAVLNTRSFSTDPSLRDKVQQRVNHQHLVNRHHLLG